ncbi:cytochrome P450 [Streptomyces longisporoflavus]|uniref:Cytochrome P450 n=1 Tax=Streptomyces longisporoflavus TaxID=28044 RepID=A0ABW7QY58_9ACTN
MAPAPPSPLSPAIPPSPPSPASDAGRNHGRPAQPAAPAPPSLLAPGVERDPYPLYRTLRETLPLVRDEMLGAWLISRYAEVRTVLDDTRSRPAGTGPGPAAPALLEPPLRAAAERIAYVLARRMARRREVDLVAEFTAWLPAAAAVAALGLPREDAARVREWCRTGSARAGGIHPEFGGLLRPHVARRRDRPGADLLSVLCRAGADGQAPSDEAVTALAAALLTGGGEATALALASFLANLLDHPAQLDLVRARPELIPGAWAESLRRDPPTPVVLRRTSAPVTMGGTALPAGSVVACLIGSAGRDPFRFADPDRYDIFRADPAELADLADPAHLAFGAEGRRCPAATVAGLVAGLVAECGLRALLDAMPGLRWAPGFRPAAAGLMARAPRLLLVRPC